jgi:hypothetical protein
MSLSARLKEALAVEWLIDFGWLLWQTRVLQRPENVLPSGVRDSPLELPSTRLLLALAAIAALLTVAATMVVFGLGGYFERPVRNGGHFALLLLIAAWPLTFIATFFNVAIASAAAARLDGGRLSVGDALSRAADRLGQVILWSLLATGVGIVLREIASRLPDGGRLTSWLLGAAWDIVTLFAVPIIALEGCSPVRCVRRSAELIKQRWGEGIGGTVAVSAVFAVFVLPAAVLAGVGGGLWVSDRATGTTLIVAGFVLLLAVSSIAGAVRQVFATALYRFAIDAEPRGGFTAADLRQPFTKKRRRLFRRG